MNPRPSRSGAVALWHSTTLWTAGGLVTIGAAATIVAFAEASATIRVDRQVDWVALGVAGASTVCLAMVLWVLAGRRAIAARVEALASIQPPERGPVERTVVETQTRGVDGLVATDNMIRYHRPFCPLVAGKTARPATRAAHEAAGRRPCGMCEP